jgi:hypothetical protein
MGCFFRQKWAFGALFGPKNGHKLVKPQENGEKIVLTPGGSQMRRVCLSMTHEHFKDFLEREAKMFKTQ